MATAGWNGLCGEERVPTSRCRVHKMVQRLHRLLLLLRLAFVAAQLGGAIAHSSSRVAIIPHNHTQCLEAASGRAGAAILCEQFAAFAAGELALKPAACIGNNTIGPDDAYVCLLESRCLAVYDVATCLGPGGFNYSTTLFDFHACSSLVAQENATLLGSLAYAGPAGCDMILLHSAAGLADDGAAAWMREDSDAVSSSGPSSLPPLPRFHPCAGALDTPEVERIRQLSLRAGRYVTHNVIALSPSIGPVAGGVSIGVCGLGFTMANEAIAGLACKFTDGHNELAVAAAHVDEHQLRCDVPDFSRFPVGLPHNVSVEVSANRGVSWTRNHVQFTYYSSRPAINAYGHPIWGYEETFSKAAWQVTYEENDFGGRVQPVYTPSGHPANRGRPSEWDSYRDPFHARGVTALWNPVELDVADRFEPAEDVDVRAEHAKCHGVEGCWGDRMSFLRAHHLVRDTYRQDVVAARARARTEAKRINNGVI